jgi:hypothetical protein
VKASLYFSSGKSAVGWMTEDGAVCKERSNEAGRNDADIADVGAGGDEGCDEANWRDLWRVLLGVVGGCIAVWRWSFVLLGLRAK